MLTDLQVEQFDELGYVVVEKILPEGLLAELIGKSCALGKAQPTRWGWNECACFRHAAFRNLLDVAELIEPAQQLTGADIQLLQLDLLRVHAGSGTRDWHRDVEIVFDRTLSVSCAIYLQNTTLDRGPLRVVPGSHRWQPCPLRGDTSPHDDEVALPVSAGSAIFHDAGLWHTASPNRSSIDCWGIFPVFGPYWIKRRAAEFHQSLPADLLRAGNPLKRQLLGLGLQPGMPTFLGDAEEYNRRGDTGIDYPAD